MGSNAEVIVGRHGSPPFALSAFPTTMLPGSFGAPFGDSPIEDDVDVRVILEALDEMLVQPRVIARDHELVSHGEAILRRSPIMHGQNSSRTSGAADPGTSGRPPFYPASRRPVSR